MDRLNQHGGTTRRLGSSLKATALAAALLGVCGLGTADLAYAQAGVESAIINSGATAPAKPMKMSASGPIVTWIGSPATAR